MVKKGDSKRGKQTKAGQLLSSFLRSISEEETEFLKGDDGEDKMATKAEHLARLMWKMALGYKEEIELVEGKKEIHYYPPDRAMMSLLFDRIEGKAQPMADPKSKQSIPDKVTEQGVNRINKAGGIVAGE